MAGWMGKFIWELLWRSRSPVINIPTGSPVVSIITDLKLACESAKSWLL